MTKRELGSGSRERKRNGNEEERGNQRTGTFAALEGEKKIEKEFERSMKNLRV